MSIFPFRKPRARTSPQRDLSATLVSVTKSHREVIDHVERGRIDFDLSGFHAVEDYIRDELKAQGLMRGDGGE